MNIAARNRRPLIVLAALALLSGASFTPVFAADRGTVDDEAAYSPKDPEVECDLNPERCGETEPEPCMQVDNDCSTGPNGDYCERNRQECINWYCDRHPEKCGENPTPRPVCGKDDDDVCWNDGDPVYPRERVRPREEE